MSAPLILIVDDEEIILSVYKLALEAEGYRVLTAQDGQEGLSLAREHMPEIILSDINMPGINGKSMLEQLRSDPDLAHLQFVFMTGNPHDTSPREGMVRGADDFLTKPIDHQSLIQCVKSRLKRARINQRVEEKILTELRTGLRANLPHEIFTPMAGIVGIAYLLRDSWESLSKGEINQLLTDLERSGWRLERTLRNYLTILDLEEQDIASGEAMLDPDSVQRMIREESERIAKNHDRPEDLQIASLAPISLLMKNDHFLLLVQEVVENAFAFSCPGQMVHLSLDEKGNFTVIDHGSGMKTSEIARIRAFQQFNRSQKEQQGLGLGLALVKKILDLNQCDWTLTSEPDRGTSLILHLPAGPNEGNEYSQPVQQSTNG